MVQTYEICKNAELGRYAIASRNLKAGDVILEEVPFTHGPKVVKYFFFKFSKKFKFNLIVYIGHTTSLFGMLYSS